jgi:methyl-accepting chemotaxis protein/methyl-accepting chemotaxis protein-1 (serine sensor receptor)
VKSTEKHRLTVDTKLLGVFAAMSALIVSLVCGWAAYYRSCGNQLDVYARKLYIGSQVELATTEMQGAQRGLMLSYAMQDAHASGQYVDLYAASSRKIDGLLQQLRPLMSTDLDRDALERIAKNQSAWQPRFGELKRVCESGDIQAAYRLRNQNKLISAEMHKGATELVAEQAEAREALQGELNRNALRIAGMALLLSVALGVAGGLVVRNTTLQLRRSIADLHDGADHVAAAALRIASSSREVAQGAAEQARSLEETSASSREMSSATSKNAADSQQAATFVNALGCCVGEAEVTLASLVESMEDITSSSGRISQIMRVVDEIAFQTKLLGLNAAVEAARAGNAGSGFAVVAEEVRNLAQRSAQAAQDTAELIEQSMLKSREGGSRLAEVGASIRAITESAEKVKGLVNHVDASTRSQAQGIERISTAVLRMDEVTRRTVHNAQESAETTSALHDQSERLMTVVERLRVLVGSEG